MKILLDECLDWRLSRAIADHDVKTARQMWWTGIKNGELLARAVSHGFEAFVTSDQNLSYQQNVPTFRIAIVVLKARSNRLTDLKRLVPILLTVVEQAKLGATVVVAEA